MTVFIQYVAYFIILVALVIPLGAYIGKVMRGEHVFLSRICGPCERLVYRIMSIDSKGDMNAKTYVLSAVLFNAIGFFVLFVMLLIQGTLSLNPEKISDNSWHLVLNTVVSFMTSTNWQAYSGETALSYLSQMMGLTVQNFVSATCGMAALFAVVRGFTRMKTKGPGNFWVDSIKSVLYILMPISMAGATLLAFQGVVQSFHAYDEAKLLKPMAADAEGNVIEGAVIDAERGIVTVGGILVEGAPIITKQMVPLGPAVSQIAIKQLGTNGGGFFGPDPTHPFENPAIFSNLIEMLFLLPIPVSLCFTFGVCARDKRQGIVIFVAMVIMLMTFMAVCGANGQDGTPQLLQNGTVVMESADSAAGGNMEGKETRFGIATPVTWAAWIAAASNGSVSSMHDSYTSLGDLMPMLQTQLGEAISGGVGCGLYGMLAFVILVVFVTGLMVGRMPEYLGKEIEPFEMKMMALCCLATPLVILLFNGIATLVPFTMESLNNSGAHGLSEILYTHSSGGDNNGSAPAGSNVNIPFINMTTGLTMLGARFIPVLTMIYAAGSLVAKKEVVVTADTLSTCNGLFVFLLVFVVLLVGTLSSFPALFLGPTVEYFQMMAQGRRKSK